MRVKTLLGLAAVFALILGTSNAVWAQCFGTGGPNGVLESGEECDTGVSTCSGGQNDGKVCHDDEETRTGCATFTSPCGCPDDPGAPVFGTVGTCTGSAGRNDVPDACRSDCTAPVCGDGVTDTSFGETCDDGNNVDGDSCHSDLSPTVADCVLNVCGDGVSGTGEQCDTGTNTITCDSNCTTPNCPDGLFNPFSTANAVAGVEQCDDGNTILGDGCALSCRSETCGNAVTDALAGEVCDNGPSGTGGVAVCSGGVNAGLPCDGLGDIACPFGFCLGNQQNRFGTAGLGYSTGGSTFLCRTNCLGTNRCGDTITDQTEACDSGSIAASDCDGSGAPSAERCTTPRCGDGFTNSGAGEQCDFGAANMDFNSLCRFGTAALTDPCELPFCGDGITDTGLSPFFTETCDTGGVNASNCDGSNCTTATCGDGTLNAAHDPDGGGPATGEECEDSNTVNNDGCSNTCQLPECGDGITQAVNGEECDSTADDCSEGSAGNCLGCCFDGTVGAGFTDVADLLTTLIDCRLEALEALADCDSRLERLAARAKEKAEQAELFNAAGDPVKAEKFLERAHRRLAKLLAKLSNARVAANCAADLACIQANAENAQDLALNGIANL